MNKLKILVVDDESRMRKLVRDFLEKQNFDVLEAGDGAHAVIGVDREYGPGHWFNAACLEGKVVAIDGQSGEVLDWPPDYGHVVNWEMSV